MKRKTKTACPCHAVAYWATRYENHDTRKLKSLLWIPTPVHHDGLAFRVVITSKDGERVLAAWYLILQVAARSPVRGVLASESLPYAPQHLATMTGATPETFTEAFRVLSGPEVGWLVPVPWPLPANIIGHNEAGSAWYKSADSPDTPGDSPDKTGDGPQRREGKEGKGTTGTEIELNGNEKKDWNGREGVRGNGVASRPAVDSTERRTALDRFKQLGYTGAEAVRFAVTGDKNGDIRATDVQEAIGTIPEPELLSIAAECYAVRMKQGSPDAGYLVGVVRNLVKDLAAKKKA